ncbi:MAG: amino acid ABC transporter permease [Lachnospiraceae bacterium]|nr:MAG: amino acid ABC transporter permease [Lachnospiraceae bacterium]
MRPFNPMKIPEFIPQLLPFLSVTLAIMLATVFFGGILGFILAFCKLKGRVSAKIAQAYIYIIRCIPSIVMLFMVYYGLPKFLLVFNIDINNYDRAFFVILTFSLLFAASMAEVFRTAYIAIDKGQTEAALSIGLTPLQAFIRIVFPQALVVALPNFTNALVNLMKEGALAYTIGLIDLMGKGDLIIYNNQGAYNLETYIALSLIYWAMTIIIEKTFMHLEMRLSRQRTTHDKI